MDGLDLSLESALDGCLHCLDVVRLNTYDVTAEGLFDSVHELPGCAVVNKVNGHTLATEASRASCESRVRRRSKRR